MFVAIMLLIAGVLDVIYGIGAIADANFWVGENHFVLGNLHTWGWITLIVGVVQLIAGFSLFAGGTFGRVIGIVAASLGALAALLAVGGAYPFWALGVFAICVICIHGLVVYGEPLEEEHRLPGSNDSHAGAPRSAAGAGRG
jgi:signal transduction histidine kinase